MVKVPILKPHDVAATLERLGFHEVKQGGAHRLYRCFDGRKTTVPFHAGQDISPILVREITKDIGCSIKDFLRRGRWG
jgi:predicted RNA binding protein YcfA (HicA-like mRNA interferase family)